MLFHAPFPIAYQADCGPFDLIGDVHGCARELESLLKKLGYELKTDGPAGHRHYRLRHPEGRKPVFLGDLVDRGPASPDVIRLVMHVVAEERGYCVVGNHDDKFMRWLEGRSVKLSHGIEETIRQYEAQSDEFRAATLDFLRALPDHLVLDEGRLVVAHAGLREHQHGRTGRAVRGFAMYGAVARETDEHGLPIRLNWAKDYHGKATVVHGHVAKPPVRELNNVICIDTGCVFGGHLTALRWPERETVQVPAERRYFSSPSWEKHLAR